MFLICQPTSEDIKHHFIINVQRKQPRSSVKVEVDVLGSQFLISPMVSVDVTQYFNNNNNSTESIRLIRDKEKGGRGMEVGEVGDYTPIATLSPNAVLKTRRLNICYRDARFCRQQEQTSGLQTTRTNMWPTAVHAATHQILRQQGGTGEDGHIHPADWSLSCFIHCKLMRSRPPVSKLYNH